MDTKKYPYYEEIDAGERQNIVDACKSFFGADFDKLATVRDSIISYNGYNLHFTYSMKDESNLLDFTITFLLHNKRDKDVPLLPSHGVEKSDSTVPAQLLIVVTKGGREHRKTTIIENIEELLKELFNPGVPVEYITQYDRLIAQRALVEEKTQRVRDDFIEDGKRRDEANETYDESVRFITQKMEAVLLSNYQQVLSEIKGNGAIATNYGRITHEQRKQWFIDSTIQAAKNVFRKIEEPSLRSSYNNAQTSTKCILLKLPQNMKL